LLCLQSDMSFQVLKCWKFCRSSRIFFPTYSEAVVTWPGFVYMRTGNCNNYRPLKTHCCLFVCFPDVTTHCGCIFTVQ
jgi:hypothetical protein